MEKKNTASDGSFQLDVSPASSSDHVGLQLETIGEHVSSLEFVLVALISVYPRELEKSMYWSSLLSLMPQ